MQNLWSKEQDVYMKSMALVSTLKDCAFGKDLNRGNELHADILKKSLLIGNTFIGTSLVNMYAKCCALARAKQVFDDLPSRNVVSWNVLITAYVQHEHIGKAFNCFDLMRTDGIAPNAATFISILKACNKPAMVERGIRIHDEIIKQGFLGQRTVLGTAILDMYGKCGDLYRAKQAFDDLPVCDLIAWNALIAGYVQNGHEEKALTCYDKMQDEGFSPNEMTFSCLIKACASMGAIEKGKGIHDKIVQMGLLPKNIILGNALLDMYLKCGLLVKAQQVFDQLPAHDVVSWTTLITGYCLHGLGKRALECFRSMQDEGLSPTPVTMLCMLRVCSTVGDLRGGISIHSEIIRKDHLKNFSMLGNALIDMYAKCGAPTKALEVFSGIQDRDKVTWTTLITAYCQQAYVEEALKCFECMQDEGLSPDAVMFSCVLQACGTVSAIQRGESLHAEILRRGLLANDIVLGTALVDFYAKCSALTKAHKIFEDLVGRTVVTWNTLIGRYSEVGMYNMVFELLNQMRRAGVEPDLITFVIVLNACSYVGLVDKGEMYWEMMSAKYGLNVNSEHQIAIINLHSHAGYFDKAKEIIDNMSSFDNIHMWLALLSACQKWGHLKLGRLSFENVVRLNRKCRAAYTCMIDIYCKAGMQTDADRVQSMSLDSGA